MKFTLIIVVCGFLSFFSYGGLMFLFFLSEYFRERKEEIIEEDIYSVDLTLHHELKMNEDEKSSKPLR